MRDSPWRFQHWFYTCKLRNYYMWHLCRDIFMSSNLKIKLWLFWQTLPSNVISFATVDRKYCLCNLRGCFLCPYKFNRSRLIREILQWNLNLPCTVWKTAWPIQSIIGMSRRHREARWEYPGSSTTKVILAVFRSCQFFSFVFIIFIPISQSHNPYTILSHHLVLFQTDNFPVPSILNKDRETLATVVMGIIDH